MPTLGYAVIATLLPHESQDHLKKLGAHVFVSDVTSDADCALLRESVKSLAHGKLDVLINNAYAASRMRGTSC